MIRAILASLVLALPVLAEDKVLNLFIWSDYLGPDTIANFTKATGIKVNRVDADDAGILARLKAEGAASPADVILLVDAARLWKGDVDSGKVRPLPTRSNGMVIRINLPQVSSDL